MKVTNRSEVDCQRFPSDKNPSENRSSFDWSLVKSPAALSSSSFHTYHEIASRRHTPAPTESSFWSGLIIGAQRQIIHAKRTHKNVREMSDRGVHKSASIEAVFERLFGSLWPAPNRERYVHCKQTQRRAASSTRGFKGVTANFHLCPSPFGPPNVVHRSPSACPRPVRHYYATGYKDPVGAPPPAPPPYNLPQRHLRQRARSSSRLARGDSGVVHTEPREMNS